jgi:hypothetical protein
MLVKVNGRKDFGAGMIYVVSGIGLFLWSQSYEIGTATRMGPGYFPALLGIILTALGLGAIVKGIRATKLDPIPRHKLEPLFLMLASIVSFGLLIPRAGLVPATFVCLLLACLRRAITHPFEVFFTFAALSAFNLVVFVYALGMPLKLFW